MIMYTEKTLFVHIPFTELPSDRGFFRRISRADPIGYVYTYFGCIDISAGLALCGKPPGLVSPPMARRCTELPLSGELSPLVTEG